jgi:hypothetical protein
MCSFLTLPTEPAPVEAPGISRDAGTTEASATVEAPAPIEASGAAQGSGSLKSPEISKDAGATETPGRLEAPASLEAPGLVDDITAAELAVPSIASAALQAAEVLKTPASLNAPLKIYHCRSVQEGHSFAEDRVYNILWNAQQTRPETHQTRLVTIGYRTIARLAAMTPRNAKENCRRLVQKLSLEPAAAYDSARSLAITYRIFAYDEILRKRRETGLEWVVRNRGGVTFVDPATGLPLSSQGPASLEGPGSTR